MICITFNVIVDPFCGRGPGREWFFLFLCISFWNKGGPLSSREISCMGMAGAMLADEEIVRVVVAGRGQGGDWDWERYRDLGGKQSKKGENRKNRVRIGGLVFPEIQGSGKFWVHEGEWERTEKKSLKAMEKL